MVTNMWGKVKEKNILMNKFLLNIVKVQVMLDKKD